MGVRYSKTYTNTVTDRHGQRVTYRTTRSRRGLWGATMGPYRPRTQSRTRSFVEFLYISALVLTWLGPGQLAPWAHYLIGSIGTAILLAIAVAHANWASRRDAS